MLDDPYEQPGESDTAKAAATLASLPSLEDTEAQVKNAVDQLSQYISTMVPGARWEQTGDRMGSGCLRPYNGTDGDLVYLPRYVAETQIPDNVWPQVFERAKELAATLGATGVERFHDEPGNHDVRFYSKEGTTIHLAAGGNTVLASITGCRLTQAKMTAPPPPPSTPHP
ncbi:hypothetical protein GCM10027169_16910 [Gordonia jinhuaensis]|uniref:Lipoprotein n=1 Tax=Gordonia jinhuaensis TaxID=1517702 RepID=A0A916TJP8_9ACTN|nr:hypothetical protein GCM10011489_38790 [Gordonia jinhuaensis]